jgi:hypothetical protein
MRFFSYLKYTPFVLLLNTCTSECFDVVIDDVTQESIICNRKLHIKTNLFKPNKSLVSESLERHKCAFLTFTHLACDWLIFCTFSVFAPSDNIILHKKWICCMINIIEISLVNTLKTTQKKLLGFFRQK